MITVLANPLFACLLLLATITVCWARTPLRRQGPPVIVALAWLAHVLLAAVAGGGGAWTGVAAVLAGAEVLLLLLLLAGGRGVEPPVRSPAASWAAAGLFALAAAFILWPASPLGIGEEAAVLRLPWLEALTLAILLASPPQLRFSARLAAALPLASLATLRFGSAGTSLPLRTAVLAAFALGLLVFAGRPALVTPYQEPAVVSERRRELGRRAPGRPGRPRTGSGWLAWLGVVVALLAGVASRRVSGSGAEAVLLYVIPSAFVVAAAAAADWSRFGAWATPYLSIVAWRTARTLGTVRRWLASTFRHPGFTAAAAALLAGYIAFRFDDLFLEAWGPVQSWTAATVAVVLPLLILAAHRARHRLFVADFVVDGKPNDDLGRQLAARLRHELAAITSVHRTIDEALPRSDGRVSSLEVAVEDIGEMLEKTVDTMLTMPFGKLSLGGLGNLLRGSGLLRGPRLVGSLERKADTGSTDGGSGEEGPRGLVVDLSGGRQRGSWRVTPADLAPGPSGQSTAGSDDLLGRMVRQVAFRVAASTASLGSPRWEALESFTEGLRHYRRVQLSEVDRDVWLRKAEHCFRRALEADRTFAQGHYNLGVVYSKLGDHDAALAAFRRAIDSDPTAYAPYLALAMAYFDRAVGLYYYYRRASDRAVAEDFLQARVFAGRALALAPDEPRPWNVYGAALILRAWQGLKPRRPVAQWQQEADAAIDAFRIAAALAWRRSCRCELTAGSGPAAEAERVLLICLENLAEVLFEADRPRESIDVLRQALRVAPRKPSIHFALGKALASTLPGPKRPAARFERLTEARDELYEVHGDGLPLEQRAARWAWLLAVHDERSRLMAMSRTGCGLSHEMAEACEREETEGVERCLCCLLDQAALPEGLILATPNEDAVHRGAATREYLRRLDLLRHDLEVIERRGLLVGEDLRQRVRTGLAVLEEMANGKIPARSPATPALAGWIDAQRDIQQARHQLAASDPDGAVEPLLAAIEKLRDDHARQVRDQGLDTLLARAYRHSAPRRGKPGQRVEQLRYALDYAFRGVAAAPESAARRLELAAVHEAGHDVSQARAEAQAAISLGLPVDELCDPERLEMIEQAWRNNGGQAAVAGVWADDAMGELEHLRDLLEASAVPAPDPADGGPRPLHWEAHADIHFRLGELLLARKRPEEARQNLRIALAAGYRRRACRRHLRRLDAPVPTAPPASSPPPQDLS